MIRGRQLSRIYSVRKVLKGKCGSRMLAGSDHDQNNCEQPASKEAVFKCRHLLNPCLGQDGGASEELALVSMNVLLQSRSANCWVDCPPLASLLTKTSTTKCVDRRVRKKGLGRPYPIHPPPTPSRTARPTPPIDQAVRDSSARLSGRGGGEGEGRQESEPGPSFSL